MYQSTGLGFTSTAQSQSGGGAMDVASQLAADIPIIGPFLDTIAKFLQVGKGRKEADQIVPTQNELGDFLARVSAYIPVAPSVPALQQLGVNLDSAWNAFQKFINNKQQFPDGRASAQAYATLAPLVDGFKQGIMRRIQQLGGGSSAMSLIQSGSIANLDNRVYGVPSFPDSGMLPYVPSVQYPVNQAGLFGNSELMPVLLAGGLAYLFFKRSR